MITLIEVGITSQDSLQIVETKTLRKYDFLANELGLIYKFSVEIISYVMTWDGIVTKYHKSHLKRLEIPMNVDAYIQSILSKQMTVESIFFDQLRGLSSIDVIERDEMHVEPTTHLKQASKDKMEELTNNINEESDLEDETIVVKEVKGGL
ncbi:hypothetical protein CWI38_0381p0040 [Hamiltosporidium tvaerminnensis]|uniref:Uncharacterized protein n=1 Tax=Hamiltosporidium tvaerminnensis TaxID=1176355 RepID=A0A4V2JXZ1_9MICR|nr:hypothetical protein CWI38_0474p0020 [Hamiltosporidium tvaerminnensis]TBU13612.1 hypothetical protein CWI38_0381p0040 [Hamiltosporidium tvaerminnensis]